MLIGLSYIFPVILNKKTLHNRHQPSQHRKPIIIPTSLRPTVEPSVVDCRVPSVRSLVPPFRPFVRRPFVCSITDMNLAIIPRHSLWSLCCLYHLPPAAFVLSFNSWRSCDRSVDGDGGRSSRHLPPLWGTKRVMNRRPSKGRLRAVQTPCTNSWTCQVLLFDWKKRCLLLKRCTNLFSPFFELPTEFSYEFLPSASSISILILAYLYSKIGRNLYDFMNVFLGRLYYLLTNKFHSEVPPTP